MSRVLFETVTTSGHNIRLEGFEHHRLMFIDSKDKDGYRVTNIVSSPGPYKGATLAANGGSTKAFLVVDGTAVVGEARCALSDRFDRRVGRYVSLVDALMKIDDIENEDVHEFLSRLGKKVSIRYSPNKEVA